MEHIKSLVVDDNEVNILILINMLETLDIYADQASSGLQAVEMAEKENYDIIFIDHIMPVMNGLQTTTAIRSNSWENSNTIIIILTSMITEEIRTQYRESGANDIYEKPLGLMELTFILKKWYSGLYMNTITNVKTEMKNFLLSNRIKKNIEEIEELNYLIGINYTNGNPIHYMNILQVALKDIQLGRNAFEHNYQNASMTDIQLAIHKLKSIFSVIGASGLKEEARNIELKILQQDMKEMEKNCNLFFEHVGNFHEKLWLALKKLDEFINSTEGKYEERYNPMQKQEYEQSLLNTIYYSERFEYDSIMRELENLIHRGQPEHKKEYEQAIEEMQEFNYEKVVNRMLKIKNEMGNSPIS